MGEVGAGHEFQHARRGAGTGLRRRIASSTVVAAAALIGFLGATAASALAVTPAKPILGINTDKVFELPPSEWPGMVSGMANNGVQAARYTANWESVEPSAPGASGPVYNWTFLDSVVKALAAGKIRWVPVVYGSTDWNYSYATTTTTGGLLNRKTVTTPDLLSPPVTADYPQFAAFAAALVVRYGPGGTFWAENPSITPVPVEQMQVWNEPNSSYFWAPAASPANYATLYEDTRTAVHAVNSGIEVAVGGLGNPAATFVNGMFSAKGDALPMDAVADTPYSPTPSEIVQNVINLRYALDAVGDVTTPIEVAEYGWPTKGSVTWTSTVSDATRAGYLAQVMQTLATGDCGVDMITPYTWVTPEQNPNNVYDWFGIVNSDGSATASSAAYAAEVSSLDALPAPTHATTIACGRPFSATAATATSPGHGTTCIAGTALAWSHLPVSGATISATATGAGKTWSASGTTGTNGTATVCMAIPSGTALSVTVTAQHPYFEPVATATLTTTAT